MVRGEPVSERARDAPRGARSLDFDCGEPSLDDWLRRRALQNEESGASRTYVVFAGRQVIGYYALAVGAVAHAERRAGSGATCRIQCRS